jgi:hypothetical protein
LPLSALLCLPLSAPLCLPLSALGTDPDEDDVRKLLEKEITEDDVSVPDNQKKGFDDAKEIESSLKSYRGSFLFTLRLNRI